MDVAHGDNNDAGAVQKLPTNPPTSDKAINPTCEKEDLPRGLSRWSNLRQGQWRSGLQMATTEVQLAKGRSAV
ncbi:hypothetical protein N7471_013459 [Penicillium samsonianum]|uniref:uncharacterized protein n=1 Tax=Penicillium samsonianum TaxID=1882272 RepID=UPI002547BB0C|nr:uncharacterized protein N7471_013459 [Penicillium samsonianum]KAJ6118839.1 hypothetical protein N7471_013459 [Penicillium samsonianum]